jgi:hypothetical protein
MNKLVEYNNMNLQIAEGKKKIENNEFLRDLSNLMENPEFKIFYSKHMSSWMDIKCTVTYMKLYDEFKNKYKEINNEELDKNLAIYLLCKIMKNPKLNSLSTKTVDKMLNDNKVSFFKEFESYLIKDDNKNLLTN